MKTVSFVVTCKGRLEHLKNSVLAMQHQSYEGLEEIIVVDYDSPDGAGAWCRELVDDRIKVVSLINAPTFCISHARNCGAVRCKSELIAFVDADVVVGPEYLAANIAAMEDSDCVMARFDYHDGITRARKVNGCLIVPRGVYFLLRGYDEDMKGWGVDEQDFSDRAFVYCSPNVVLLSHDTIESTLSHDDEMRTQFYDEKDKHTSNRANRQLTHAEVRVVNPNGFGVIPKGSVADLQIPRRIWTYWEKLEGRPMPEYLELCFETMVMHNPSCEFIVVSEENVRDYVPDLDPRWFEVYASDRNDPGLSIATRADYIRMRLVHEQGGIWLDADTVVVRNLDPTLELLNTSDSGIFIMTPKKGRTPNEIFFAKPKCQFLKTAIEMCEAILEKGPGIPWTISSTKLFSDVAAVCTDFTHLPRSEYLPIDWREFMIFGSTVAQLDDLLLGAPFTVALRNSLFRTNIQELYQASREDLKNSDMYLARLLKYSLTGRG